MIRQITGVCLVLALISSAYTEDYAEDVNMEQRPIKGGIGAPGTMGGSVGGQMGGRRGRMGGMGGMDGMGSGGGRMRGMRGQGGRMGGMNAHGNRMGGMNNERGRVGGMSDQGGRMGGMSAHRNRMGGMSNQGGRMEGMSDQGGRMGGMKGHGRHMDGHGGLMGGMKGHGRHMNGHGGHMGDMKGQKQGMHLIKNNGAHGFRGGSMMTNRGRRRRQGGIENMVKGMIDFDQNSYDHKSKMFRLYGSLYATVKANVGSKERILSRKLRFLSADEGAKTKLFRETFRAVKKVSDKYNKELKEKFADLVKEIGKNPEDDQLEDAKKELTSLVKNYISEAGEVIDKYEKMVDKLDKGFLIDNLKSSASRIEKMQTLMKDSMKIKIILESKMEAEVTKLIPHLHGDEELSIEQSFLKKRLENVKRKALGNFSAESKSMVHKVFRGDLETMQENIHKQHELSKIYLEKVIKEMNEIIESDKVDPSVEALRHRLLVEARKMSTEAKARRGDVFKNIMEGVVKRVHGKPGDRVAEQHIRQESAQVLGNIQNNIGNYIKQLCDEAAGNGGNTEEQMKEAMPKLKEFIQRKWEAATEIMREYADKTVQELEEGKGIYGRIKNLRARRGRFRKGNHVHKGGNGGMTKGGMGGQHPRGMRGMQKGGRGRMSEMFKSGRSKEGSGRETADEMGICVHWHKTCLTMNVFLTAAFVLSVTAMTPSTSPEPSPEPKKEDVAVDKNAADAVAAKDAKATEDKKGTKTEGEAKGKAEKNEKVTDVPDKSKNQKQPEITMKKGKLKKVAPKAMNDSPSANKQEDKKKDGTKANKSKADAGTGKTATVTDGTKANKSKADAGTGKTATVTVAQDTATEGNGVMSCHVTSWTISFVIATILPAFLRI